MNALQWNEHVYRMLLWEEESGNWKVHWKKQDEEDWRVMYLHNVEQRKKQDLKAKESTKKGNEEPWPYQVNIHGKNRSPPLPW
jgi:hypothetical protein